MKIFWILAICLCNTYTAYCADQPARFLDAKLLKELDWKSESVSKVFASAWQKYESEDPPNENNEIIKQHSIPFSGFALTGRLLKDKKTGYHKIVYFGLRDKVADITNESPCRLLQETFQQAYGQPLKKFDDSIEDVESVTSYWDVGNTRIGNTCLSSYGAPFVTFVFGDKRNERPLLDRTNIKCSMKSVKFGELNDGVTEELPPIMLVIDPNTKTLKSNTSQIGKTDIFDEKRIVNQDEKGDFKSELVLDRVAGNFVWTLTSFKGSFAGSGYKMWGDCSVYEENKKF